MKISAATVTALDTALGNVAYAVDTTSPFDEAVLVWATEVTLAVKEAGGHAPAAEGHTHGG